MDAGPLTTRIGPIAVTLGIGAALFAGAGVAAADRGSEAGSSPSSEAADTTRAYPPAQRRRGVVPRSSAATDIGSKPGTGVRTGGNRNRPERGSGVDPVDRRVRPTPDRSGAAVTAPAAAIPPRSAPATAATPPTAATPDLPALTPPPAAATPATPATAPAVRTPRADSPAPAPAAATGLAASTAVAPPAPAPAAVMRAPAAGSPAPQPNWAAGGGGLPVLQPMSWVVAAVARRQWAAAPSATVAPPAATVRASAIFGNRPPVISSVSVGRGDPATGVVTVVVTATDPNRDRLTYTASGATKGRATITSAGVLTYTPTSTARHAAAKEQAAPQVRVDTVRVTVSDTRFARVSTTVTVPIVPRNSAPVAQTTMAAPNATSGAVTGRVSATDADGDPLAFSAPASTAKGSVQLGTSGNFTYTPTGVARHAAARLGASTAEKSDAFTVTIRDGYGAVVNVPVTVAIAPRNSAPVAGATTVGTPDPSTGVVTGTVRGTDSDGDTLAFSAPASTAKGNISLNPSSGVFSYAPTAAARNAAGAPGATDADRQDSFTVTLADGFGGSAAVPVSVPVTPTTPTPPPPPPPPPPPSNLAAFPGAEGFGAAATGGRDGSVIYVTNLNSSGPGSLQWAIDQPGAKYVLFKVSGVINDQIHLTNGNVTIAGQTSPGGITIRGLVTDESPFQDQDVRAPGDFAENWILQHIRIRPGADGPSDDGLRLRYTRNAIVDHVSIGNATDEAIEISYSNNITVQNTLLAETVGYHAEYGGILMNYSNPAYGFGLDNVSLHHNVFNRIWGRLPEGSRESLAAANSTMNLELSNNLYWDPRFFVALGPNTGVVTNASGDPYPIYWKINAVNNFFRTGTEFPYGMFDDQVMRNPTNQMYFSGNKMSLYPTRSDYELFYCCNDYSTVTAGELPGLVAAQRAQKRTTRHPFPAITYTPTDQLRTVLLNTAGAWPRDPMDTRLMANVAANSIATAPIDANPAGDALRLPYTGTAPAAPADTDNDGMPDAWEVAKGLNPAVANTNARTLSTLGYTDLEVYLHELSASRITPTAL